MLFMLEKCIEFIREIYECLIFLYKIGESDMWVVKYYELFVNVLI